MRQHPQTRSIVIDQTHYVEGLKEVPLKHPSMAFNNLAACSSRSTDRGCCTSIIGSRLCSVTSWTKPDML